MRNATRAFSSRRWLTRAALLILAFWLIALPVSAQDTPSTTGVRDPLALAQRYLGYDAPYPILLPTPQYQPGDTLDFWVPQIDSPTPVKVSATLAVAAAPYFYVWVDDALEYDPAAVEEMSGQLGSLLFALRFRDNYGVVTVSPFGTRLNDIANLLPMPDVDNDPSLFILFTRDLPGDTDALYSPLDSLPAALAPGGISNQHETILVNVTQLANVPVGDPVYLSVIARAFARMLADYNQPDQAPWLSEALRWFVLLRLQNQDANAISGDVNAFLSAPNTALTRPAALTTRSQTLGMQQLFLNYLIQRYRDGAFVPLFTASGDGMTPLDAALAQAGVIDPATGEPVTARDAFADFVVTNAVDVPFGDGRFVHRALPLQDGVLAASEDSDNLTDLELADRTVNQFGTYYLRLRNADGGTFKLHFDGAAATARLPGASGDLDNHFYWSSGERNRDYTLTRAFDLRDVDSATLTFDAWYELAKGWNYGYVSVSDDAGATWQALPATDSTDVNPYGAAYGEGFTGISSRLGARPFPIMGIVIGGDGMTIDDIAPDGPAAQTDLQAGDVIVGYDGEAWQSAPNVLGLLSRYSPGDTLNLYIQRGGDRFDVPIVLGAHPTRIIEPEPLWLEQSVDLTPFAGQEILVRFEYISLPGKPNHGFAVDNIAVPELDYADDAESDAGGWALDGWQRVNNQVDQRFVVQSIKIPVYVNRETGELSSLPAVRRLLDWRAEVNEGTWTFNLLPRELLVVAVSGVNDDTDEAAAFSLRVEGVAVESEEATPEATLPGE